MLVSSGISSSKYWFSISDEEQHFAVSEAVHDRSSSGAQPMDLEITPTWEGITRAKIMLTHAHTLETPWWVGASH
jgi:polyphosphate kinase 2 (PPK2 family)